MPPQPLPAWLERAFVWLNYPVHHYWTLAALGLLAVVLLAACSSPAKDGAKRRWQSYPVFALAVIFCLMAFRWPTWFFQDEFNPDESQIIAGALTLRQHPVYWEYVDAMTQGPLNAYALTGAALAGLPLNFFGARVFALLLQAGALLLTGAALRRFVSEPVARLSLLPPLVFWSLTSHHDFLHYSSELVSLLLLALAGWLLAAALGATPVRSRANHVRLFLSGAMLGLVPLAKLQGVPPALALAAVGLVALWLRRPAAGLAPAGWFVAGGLAAPAAGVLLTVAGGQGDAAWQAYILNNLWYVGTAPTSAGPGQRLLELVNAVPAFQCFWWGGIALVGLLTLPAWKNAKPAERAALGAGWMMLVASLAAVLGPGRALPHYLEFAVLPLGVLIALHLHAAGFAVTRPGLATAKGAGLLAAFLLLGLAPQIVSRWRNHHIYAGQFAHNRYEYPPSQAAYFIHQRSVPGDTLAIWGWHAQIYVETGLAQGTREAQTERQLGVTAPMQPYYLARYLSDLDTRRPTWFVDAVGPASLGYHDRTVHGHEAFPALAQVIDARYDYVGEIENLRIYRRRQER